MSIASLITGKLYSAPETRVSKNGTEYAKATLCITSGSDRQFVTVFAFSQTVRDELARLGAGDNLSVQGSLKAEVYERDGSARVSLSITADNVLALKQPPRERKPKAPAPPPDPASQKPAREPGDLHRYASTADAALNDDIPF